MFVPNKVRTQNRNNASSGVIASKPVVTKSSISAHSSNDSEMDDVMAALLAAEKGIIKRPNKIQVAPGDNPNKRENKVEIRAPTAAKVQKIETKATPVLNIAPTIMYAPPPPPPPPMPMPSALPVSSTVLIRDAEMAMHVMQKRALENRVVTKSAIRRTAGGQIWEDATMADWDKNDYRLFVGNLGYEASDDLLIKTFSHYPSFKKGRVVRDKKTGRCKGFGFISFGNAEDYIKATKEFNGKYVGNRPIKITRSNWQKRQLTEVRKEEKKKMKLEKMLKD